MAVITSNVESLLKEQLETKCLIKAEKISSYGRIFTFKFSAVNLKQKGSWIEKNMAK